MIRINLLPKERVHRPAFAPRALALVLVGVLAFTVVASTLYLNARNRRVESQLARVNQEIEVLRPKVARVEELRRLIEVARRKEQLLRQLEALRVNWDVVLDEVRSIMPRDVWLGVIEMRDTGDMVFSGHGMSYEAVARFMVSLENSEMFKNADLVLGQKQKIASREVINFSITSTLVKERKEAGRR